ncbi:unnamed protein product [Calypogeia fissa]
MAVSVQIVSREASEQLSMKYLDLATTAPSPPSTSSKEEDVSDLKRLSLQSFLASNYANSPRRRLSVEDLCERASPSGGCHVYECQGRPKEFYSASKLNGDSILISLNSLSDDRLGPMIQLRNCMATPTELIKKSCGGGLAKSKTFQEMSWKYKLFYLCGVSNIDMVDNYVSLPRSVSRGSASAGA